MLQDNEGTISTQDQPTGSDIYVSVEMSRSKWVVASTRRWLTKSGCIRWPAATWMPCWR